MRAADDSPSGQQGPYRTGLLRSTTSSKGESFRIRTAPSRNSSSRSLGRGESPSPVRETSKLVVDSLKVGGRGGGWMVVLWGTGGAAARGRASEHRRGDAGGELCFVQAQR